MKTVLITSILLLAQLAFANEHGGAHHAEGVPMSIVYHAINIVILFGGMVYFLKKPLAQAYSERRQQFVAAASKAKLAREQAEKENQDIKNRLSKLEANVSENISRARAEAVDLKKQIVAEAESTAKRIRDEVKKTVDMELLRAENELRQKMIQESVKAARTALSDKVGAGEQTRLQDEFVDKIQVVRQ
jgi:F-type H+-transporting ATPase subunit b